MEVKEKLNQLRSAMEKRQLKAYILPTSDPHQSEYVAERFESRRYFSGFTGSAGTLVVLQDKAALWTDGRYFLQAEQELAGSDIILMKMGLEGTPEIYQFLADHLKAGQTAALDGSQFSVAAYADLQKKLTNHEIHLEDRFDLAQEAWTGRPDLPKKEIKLYPEAYAGLSVTDKLAKVRSFMQKTGASSYLVSSLDDIAWLCNLRGDDVLYTPVFYGYLLIEASKATLFINEPSLQADALASLKAHHISLADYAAIDTACQSLSGTVFLDPTRTNALLYNMLAKNCRLIEGTEFTAALKTAKNSAEIAGMKEAHLKDGLAVCQFLSWLEQADRTNLTEWDAMEKITAFRAAQDRYISNSFTSIFGLNGNGAIVHYRAAKETAQNLNKDGLMVLDSGAQYWGGTTDITRTAHFGPLTDEQKTDYTLVLKAHIALANACFWEGATGAQLDGIARHKIWEATQNYQHGTGHGVGAALAVHEGPQRLAPLFLVAIREGMINSIEPGIYKANKHGIRLENLYVAVLAAENADGRFLRFESLTMVPFHKDPIKKEMLSETELNWLNSYHQRVREALLPLIKEEVLKNWLIKKTEAL